LNHQIDHNENYQERVGVVHLELSPSLISVFNYDINRTSDESLEEAVSLAQALPFDIVHSQIISIRKPNPRTIIGKGKIEELKQIIEQEDIAVLYVNFQLSPAHQNNLERDLNIKVIDRTGLILEIFSDRARTKSGRLQVDLARTLYEQTRLVRTWTHLERQRGGLGKTGGPGERQIEIDRRLLRNKVAKLKKQLKEVEKTRLQHSKRRQRDNIKVVSLVGYTNSGKSTLFNALTRAGTLSQDMLFATLDPLMRKLELPSGETIILSDTVGFISNLPHELVEAFKSTLQEIIDSDLLLHVQDVSSEHRQQEKQDVQKVLLSIQAENIPAVDVLNKADLLKEKDIIFPDGVVISALQESGIEDLLSTIEKKLDLNYNKYSIEIKPSDVKILNNIYKYGKDIKLSENSDSLYDIRFNMKKRDYHSYVETNIKKTRKG
jgi:GTP-binding protein HflX